MDFNDIQSAWNSENTKNVVVPTQLEKVQQANTPLDKIKKNLKNEFIYQIVSIVFIGFAPYLNGFPEQAITPFYLLFSLFVAVSAYYLIKLFIFYKRLNKKTLSTKDNLYETYFDIRLNMELYKTFGFALTPFMILFLVGVLYFKLPNGATLFTDSTNSIALFVSVLFSMLFMGVALEWWVHYYYGKYAKEIRTVLDELKEE
ncbi:conserved membrane hypothetical protein [Flavobacterium sp. 9R]|uniref:hypothetical protein n=1 Tax=Flavobacterium sp. 9R TaxID=2653143 RepID=UPI0012F26F87|nr:hypothetical protein [Flavobacterium sp. 9R]VXB34940.1 conserved membrane hypothetical protein [Flavobacterium sp. 9R]